jgi:hypothetical protein
MELELRTFVSRSVYGCSVVDDAREVSLLHCREI